MRHFGDLSIRHKLTGLFMAISGFTALAVSCPMAIYDVITFRHSVAQNLAVLGDVLAGNSTAALTFRDAESARDVLRALRAEPDVTAAAIYTSDGKPSPSMPAMRGIQASRRPRRKGRPLRSRTVIWCSSGKSSLPARLSGPCILNPIWKDCMRACADISSLS
jgi:Periplasmic sensor domain